MIPIELNVAVKPLIFQKEAKQTLGTLTKRIPKPA